MTVGRAGLLDADPEMCQVSNNEAQLLRIDAFVSLHFPDWCVIIICAVQRSVQFDFDLIQAAKDKKTLQEVLITDVPTVAPDLPIKDIIQVVVDNDFPLAVVNENKKLLGVIVRGSILGALAIKEEDQNGTA